MILTPVLAGFRIALEYDFEAKSIHPPGYLVDIHFFVPHPADINDWIYKFPPSLSLPVIRRILSALQPQMPSLLSCWSKPGISSFL